MHKSKYGYHPYEYKNYKILKQLNIWYLDALRRLAAFNRWSAKQPQNRKKDPNWSNSDWRFLKELEKIDIKSLYAEARVIVDRIEDVKRPGLSSMDLKRLAIDANKFQ